MKCKQKEQRQFLEILTTSKHSVSADDPSSTSTSSPTSTATATPPATPTPTATPRWLKAASLPVLSPSGGQFPPQMLPVLEPQVASYGALLGYRSLCIAVIHWPGGHCLGSPSQCPHLDKIVLREAAI